MTRQNYIDEQTIGYKELTGEEITESIITTISQEWYNELTSKITQFAGTITTEEYNSMTTNQQWHFNKHYNLRRDKIA